MLENLNHIPASGTSYCYDDVARSCEAYGRLYPYSAALANDHGNGKDICPIGWHLPSDAEWTAFKDYLISNGYGYEGSGDDIAKSLASTSGWNFSGVPGTPGNDPASNNSSDFNALPAGFYDVIEGTYRWINDGTWFWSSTEVTQGVKAWGLLNDDNNLKSSNADPRTRNYVRCVKDSL